MGIAQCRICRVLIGVLRQQSVQGNGYHKSVNNHSQQPQRAHTPDNHTRHVRPDGRGCGDPAARPHTLSWRADPRPFETATPGSQCPHTAMQPTLTPISTKQTRARAARTTARRVCMNDGAMRSGRSYSTFRFAVLAKSQGTCPHIHTNLQVTQAIVGYGAFPHAAEEKTCTHARRPPPSLPDQR